MGEMYGIKLSEEAEQLNRYLYQYKRGLIRQHVLERRRNDIIRDFDHPLTGINYDGMPHGGHVNTGCAALSIKLDAINTRLKGQMNMTLKILADIIDVIEFLPENSPERIILEYKYIDGFSWHKICTLEHLSRTPVTRYWRKGLYKLLEFKKVRAILCSYKHEKQSGGV